MIRSGRVDAFEREYQLSLYDTLAVLNNSKKSEILLVQNALTGRIYIKKILKNYNLDVYQALKQIQTIHIPTIYEIFEEEKTLIIIEEFINGRTLEDMMTEGGILSEKEAISYMIKLCESLELLHEQTPPIIHRDIKPSNVMITNDGILKLIDFDVSRIYRQESEIDTHILGTKGYASPEQFGFEQTDGRSDIYSIGVLLNVLTVGDNPKVKKNSSSLANIIDKCTQFSPEDRYQHIGELRRELFRLLNPHKEKQKVNLQFQPGMRLDVKQTMKIVKLPCLIMDFFKYENLYQLITGKPFVPKTSKVKVVRELKQLPGYRRGNIIYATIFSLWYGFLLLALLVTDMWGSIPLMIENISMLSTLFFMTLLNTNYKNIQRKLPLIKRNRWIGLIIYNVLLFMLQGYILQFTQQ